MTNSFLLRSCIQKGGRDLRQCAEGMLNGFDLSFALHDLCQEQGFNPMQSIKEGQAYNLRTFAHYYKGRVKSVSFTDVVLTNASTIFEEGSAATMYAKDGKPAQEEHFPPHLEIVINAGHIVAAIPFSGKLNGE